MKALETRLATLKRIATSKGAYLYVILNRRADWAVQWYEADRQEGDDFKSGLVVYHYYPTFSEMLKQETKRLKEL
jgi:hypothetical protein